MQSKARTVDAYLKELPPDRRAALETVRRTILASVDDGVEEGMGYGMIGYHIPHHVFPNGYHVDPSMPLPYLGLASQKQNMAVYVMFDYVGEGGTSFIRKAYAAKGRTLDMGKSCLRFRTLADLDLEILAEAIRRAPSREYAAKYFAAVGPGAWKSKGTKAAQASAAKRPAAKASKTKKAAKKK